MEPRLIVPCVFGCMGLFICYDNEPSEIAVALSAISDEIVAFETSLEVSAHLANVNQREEGTEGAGFEVVMSRDKN